MTRGAKKRPVAQDLGEELLGRRSVGAAAQVSEREVMGSRDRGGESGKDGESGGRHKPCRVCGHDAEFGFYLECSEDHWKAASTDEMEPHS